MKMGTLLGTGIMALTLVGALSGIGRFSWSYIFAICALMIMFSMIIMETFNMWEEKLDSLN